MLAAGHTRENRVILLLEAAQEAVHETGGIAPFGARPIGLELSVVSPDEPLADATNFLGGVGDVLEVKGRREALDHLGALASVGLYDNDRHIHEVRYRWRSGPEIRYFVRLWELTE